MKKNFMMRAASVLLVAVMLTTCAISGTFAKYVTAKEGSDSARVAKFGVVVAASGSLFSKNYLNANDNTPAADGADAATITVKSSDEDKLVAPGTKNENGITFAVTAVNNEGVESARALAYRNPDDLSSSVEELTASIVNDELQVAIKSNSYAGKYRLYSRKSATAEWVLVQESLYPIIIEKSYDSLLKYGVSVESLYGGESEITPISSYRNAPVSIDYKASNILSGITFDTTPLANSVIHTPAYGYQTLTDGSFNSTTGRFSTKTADTLI